MIVHQTAKTRCMTRHFFRATFQWVFRPYWSFYFHDDAAVDRLLQTPFPEFPHLHQVARSCLTSRASRIALWRLVVLWCYGGLHVDLNTFPTANFTSATIQAGDEGIFFWETPESGNEQILSTKVVAVAPYHPLLYYAIQEYLARVLHGGSNGAHSIETKQPATVSMSTVWQKALQDFTRLGKPGIRRRDQVIAGSQGRTIRTLGTVANGNEQSAYFYPLFVSENGLSNEFLKMGMERMGPPSVSATCFRDMMMYKAPGW